VLTFTKVEPITEQALNGLEMAVELRVEQLVAVNAEMGKAPLSPGEIARVATRLAVRALLSEHEDHQYALLQLAEGVVRERRRQDQK
jgi:hypothetical protein